MNRIKIETEYTAEDYVRTETFLENLQTNSSPIVKFGSRFLVVFAFIELVFAFILLNEGKIGIAVFAVFCAFLLFFLVYKFIPSYYKSPSLNLFKARLKNIDSNSILFSKREIVFGEEGVTETYNLKDYLTGWQAISKVVETDEDFLFYLHNTVRFQPKRDIPDEQIDHLRILIKANLREHSEFQLLTTN